MNDICRVDVLGRKRENIELKWIISADTNETALLANKARKMLIYICSIHPGEAKSLKPYQHFASSSLNMNNSAP